MTPSIGTRIQRWAAAASAAVAMALGAAPAQAVLIVGTWDPAFGPALPDLGFRGKALFYVPDACLTSAGVKVSGVGCSAGDPMRIDSAFVELYNLSDESTTLETLWYVTPPASDSDALNQVLVEAVGPGFEVTSLDTDTLGPVESTIEEAGGNFFYLDFFSSFCFDCEGGGDFVLPDSALNNTGQAKERFSAQIFACLDDDGCPLAERTPSNAATVTLTRIPEPAMALLVSGALLTLLLVRRRMSPRGAVGRPRRG